MGGKKIKLKVSENCGFQDRHLTEPALKAAVLRRQQLAASGGSSTPSPTGAPPVAPPVYPPDAALQAIRRYAIRPPYPELMVGTCFM